MKMGARFLVGFLLTTLSCLLAPGALALGALPLNGSANGALSASHTSDLWSITVLQDGSLTVTIVSDASLEIDTKMYDTDGTTQVASDTGYGTVSSLTFDHFRPGTYTVNAYRWSGEGNYAISNTFTPAPLANDPEPNDVFSQASALGPNATATGHIGYYGSLYTDLYDWYRITVPEDGDLTITVTQDRDGDLVDVDLFDTDGTTVLSTSHVGTSVETVRRADLMPGTYYLRIKRYAGFCNYTVQSTFDPPAWGNDAEPNDTAQQAVGLTPDASITGHIGYYTSGVTDLYDWFRIALPSDGQLTLTITQDRDGDILDTDLYASDGTTVMITSHVGTAVETLSRADLAAGTYLLRVRRYAGFCTYEVRSSFAPQPLGNDIEPNNSAPTAQDASLTLPQRGHMGYTTGLATDTVDWFRFTLLGDGALWLDILSDATADIEADLFKADGTTLVSSDHQSGPRSRVGSDELLAGVYLLRLARYSGYAGYTVTPSGDQYFVNLLGPATVVPGERVTYMVRYANPSGAALQDAVVLVDLPYALSHAGATGGGLFYTGEECGNQVFWRLGALPAGGNGQVTFTLSVPWGTPNADTWAIARMGASNFPGGGPFDVTPYLAFAPDDLDVEWTLTPAEITAELASDTGLRMLYDQALASGHHFFGSAMGWLLSDGGRFVRFFMIRDSDGSPTILSSDGRRAFAEMFAGNTYTLFDVDGGSTWDRDQGLWTPWGEWATPSAGGFRSEGLTGLAEARCQFNCTLNSIPDTAAGHLIDLYGSFQYVSDCVKCKVSLESGTPDYEACSKCSTTTAEKSSKTIAEKIPGVGTAVGWALSVKKCLDDCLADPSKHICTQDKKDCGCWDLLGWLGGFESRCVTACNRTTGTYAPITQRIQCAYGEVCSGGNCVDSKQGCSRATSSCRDREIKVRPSHDPNAKRVDYLGDVLPGQRLTYTLEYENAGTGTAYGVFILDRLDDNLDGATLIFNDPGTFSASSRMVDFEVGDVPPGGQGSVSFSVAVKAGTPTGTEIVNEADIYFPNALEITPTNSTVNRAVAVAADPMNLAAVSEAPLGVTLSGRSASGGALSYAVTSSPAFGALTGAPPNLTYTSQAGFTGLDTFTYSVGDGADWSEPAEVRVTVGPDPDDATPPSVVGTYPEDGASGIRVNPEPVGTDPLQYMPTISATFSESLARDSVTATALTVDGLAGTVAYDEATRSVTFTPGQPLSAPRTYTVRMLAGVRDLAGNVLAQEHAWSFTTEGGIPGDCDGDGTVSIGEVQKAINMFLGTMAPACGVDCNGDGTVSIGEVQKVINAFLGLSSTCL